MATSTGHFLSAQVADRLAGRENGGFHLRFGVLGKLSPERKIRRKS
jgi:hypothetical protein